MKNHSAIMGVSFVFLTACSPAIIEKNELTTYEPKEIAKLYCESVKTMNLDQLIAISTDKFGQTMHDEISGQPSDVIEQFKERAKGWDCAPELTRTRDDGRLHFKFPDARGAKTIILLPSDGGGYLVSK